VAPREDPLGSGRSSGGAELGVHRDREGVFFDRVLEQACSSHPLPAACRPWVGLAGPIPAVGVFGLAIEPVLLAQLREHGRRLRPAPDGAGAPWAGVGRMIRRRRPRPPYWPDSLEVGAETTP